MLTGGFNQYFNAVGSIACLNIWAGSLDNNEMLDSGSCRTTGDIYGWPGTINHEGSYDLKLRHPEYTMETGTFKFQPQNTSRFKLLTSQYLSCFLTTVA